MKSLFAAGLLALFASTVLAAGPPYFIIDLGALPIPGAGGAYASVAAHISNAGQVTGAITLADHTSRAFLYSNGTMQNLGTLPGGYSSAGVGVNNLGQVTGYAYPSTNMYFEHPFRYSGGVMQDLGLLLGLLNYSYGDGYAINDAGSVTGCLGNTAGFLASGGTMVPLGTLDPNPNDIGSLGHGINASGQVTGWAITPGAGPFHAFLYPGGSMSVPGTLMQDLGTLGGSTSYGEGINDAGQVTGYSYLPGDVYYHAFLYTGGTMQDLAPLPGYTESIGYAINNPGQVVGRCDTITTYGPAMLYSGGTMYNLNSLATNLSISGINILSQAYGINDQGWIVGVGQAGDGDHAFLAIPTGASLPQAWRQAWYGTTANTGNAADTATPYGNGVANLAVLAFFGPSQSPATAPVSQLPQPQKSGGNYIYSFTEPAGVSGITYGAEWSTTLAPGSWQPISDTGSGTQHTFSTPIGSYAKLFTRLVVTEP